MKLKINKDMKIFLISILAPLATIMLLFAYDLLNNVFFNTVDLGKGDPQNHIFTCSSWGGDHYGCNFDEYFSQFFLVLPFYTPIIIAISFGIFLILGAIMKSREPLQQHLHPS